MSKFDNGMIYDEVTNMIVGDKDIILIKINTYAETEEDITIVKDTVERLSNVLRSAGIDNPVIVLGADAEMESISPEMMEEFGFYRKDIETKDEDPIDEIYN